MQLKQHCHITYESSMYSAHILDSLKIQIFLWLSGRQCLSASGLNRVTDASFDPVLCRFCLLFFFLCLSGILFQFVWIYCFLAMHATCLSHIILSTAMLQVAADPRRFPRSVLLAGSEHRQWGSCDELVGLWLPDCRHGEPHHAGG